MADAGFPVIDLPPEVGTPEAAVRSLVAELVRAGSLPAAAVIEANRAVWQRERLGSTAVGRGVAIPHAKVRGAPWPVGVIGRCASALNWPGASAGSSVSLVCLVLAPAGSGAPLLGALERLSRQLRGG